MEKQFLWDLEKNEWLKKERNISFESIVYAIESGFLRRIDRHPKPEYAHQKIMLVELFKYIYVVPFIETDDFIHLITVFPSRKATKSILGKEAQDD